jgi:hypothetical protein
VPFGHYRVKRVSNGVPTRCIIEPTLLKFVQLSRVTYRKSNMLIFCIAEYVTAYQKNRKIISFFVATYNNFTYICIVKA